MCFELHESTHALPIKSSSQNSMVCGCELSFPASKFQAKPSKKHKMRLPFWESFPDSQNGGRRFASFSFTITTAPTPILGVDFRLPKWELLLNSFLHLFKDYRHEKEKLWPNTQNSNQTIYLSNLFKSYSRNKKFFHKSLAISQKR